MAERSAVAAGAKQRRSLIMTMAMAKATRKFKIICKVRGEKT